MWAGVSSFQGQPGSGQADGLRVRQLHARWPSTARASATYLLNTGVVSLLTVAGTLVVSMLGGYAFARFRFPGKNVLFLAHARRS